MKGIYFRASNLTAASISPLADIWRDDETDITGLDRVLAIAAWLQDRSELQSDADQSTILDLLLSDRIEDWRLKDVDTTSTLNPDAGILPEAHRSDFRFRLSPTERRDLISALQSAAPDTACASLEELAQIKLLTRKGAWLEGLYT